MMNNNFDTYPNQSTDPPYQNFDYDYNPNMNNAPNKATFIPLNINSKRKSAQKSIIPITTDTKSPLLIFDSPSLVENFPTQERGIHLYSC